MPKQKLKIIILILFIFIIFTIISIYIFNTLNNRASLYEEENTDFLYEQADYLISKLFIKEELSMIYILYLDLVDRKDFDRKDVEIMTDMIIKINKFNEDSINDGKSKMKNKNIWKLIRNLSKTKYSIYNMYSTLDNILLYNNIKSLSENDLVSLILSLSNSQHPLNDIEDAIINIIKEYVRVSDIYFTNKTFVKIVNLLSINHFNKPQDIVRETLRIYRDILSDEYYKDEVITEDILFMIIEKFSKDDIDAVTQCSIYRNILGRGPFYNEEGSPCEGF